MQRGRRPLQLPARRWREADAQFARHDLRQRGLAEAGGTDEQHMVERLAPFARGLDEDREVGARLLLADEFRQELRAQRGVAAILAAALRRDDAGGRGHVGEIPRGARSETGARTPLPLAGPRRATLALGGWGTGFTRGPPPWPPPAPTPKIDLRSCRLPKGGVDRTAHASN